MSIKAMTWVWDHSPHKGTTLLLLLALADAANDDGVCWPGLARLAKKARIDKRHVIRLIEELEAYGSIKVRRRKDGKLNKSNVYQVVTDESLVTQEPLGSDIDVTRGSDMHVTRVVTPMSPEPSLNRNIEPSINPKGRRATRRSPKPEFEKRTVGKSKADERTKHPAIQMIREVTGRLPAKAAYDFIIAKIGDQPDSVEFKRVQEAWVLKGYSPTNIGGMLDWYTNGIPLNGNGKSHNGNGNSLQASLDVLAEMRRKADNGEL